MTIKDKTVLLTGANRAIGQALAAQALARGAKRVYAGARSAGVVPGRQVTSAGMDWCAFTGEMPHGQLRWPQNTARDR